MMAYRWLMIIDSPVLCNSCYWSLMWGLVRGRWSRRRPSSRDEVSVWTPQVEAVWTCRAVDMFKRAWTKTPLIMKLNCKCYAFLVRQERCAAQTSSTTGGRPRFSIKVVQISLLGK